MAGWPKKRIALQELAVTENFKLCFENLCNPFETFKKRAKLKTKQAGKNKTMPTGCAKHFPQQLIRQQGHATDE